jgi:hypothetical protein
VGAESHLSSYRREAVRWRDVLSLKRGARTGCVGCVANLGRVLRTAEYGRSVGRSATRRPGALIQPCVNASGSEEVESLEALRPLAIHDVSR